MKVRIVSFGKDYVDFDGIVSYVYEGEFLKMQKKDATSYYRIGQIEWFTVMEDDATRV